MPAPLNLQNKRFGKLVGLYAEGRDAHGALRWRFQCDCGETPVVRGSQVKCGYVSSCGCGIREAARQPRKHGATHTALYRRWRAMLSRTGNKRNAEYRNYGGRGVAVCDRWLQFDNFASDMGPTFDERLELDRIDVDGDYEPANCRWATRKLQQRNKRTNHYIEFDGRRMTLIEWSEESGIKPNTLIYRLRRGWPLEKALAPQSALEIANAAR